MTDPAHPTNPHPSSLPDDQTTILPGGLPVPPSLSTEPPVPEPATDRLAGRVYGAGDGYASGEIYGAPRRPAPVDAVTPESAAPAVPPAPLPGADRGSTSIDPEVVERVIRKIVDLTVDDVDGVHGLYEPAGDDTDADRPVSVALDGDEARITLAIRVQFGHAVHQVVEQVRSRVVIEGERLLGLSVSEVNVRVADVVFESGA